MEDTNVDYRKMYYHLAGAVETALRILIAAQQDCENILLESDASSNLEEIATSPSTSLRVLAITTKNGGSKPPPYDYKRISSQ